MQMLHGRKRTRRGFVLIYYSLTLMIILPMVGLAVDLGMLYNVKSKLTAALDAASLSAGRCFDLGIPFADAEPVAVDTARMFFKANFPDHYWGVNVGEPVVDIQNTSTGIVVKVNASVDSPLMFMRVFDMPSAQVGTASVAVRRNIKLVLVLDRSGSIARAPGAPAKVIESSEDFVNRLVEENDQVGLVSFSGYIKTHFAPSSPFKDAANAAIDVLPFDGWTNSSGALATAYELLLAEPKPGAVNVIVFFTDGRPTALSAKFETRKEGTDQRYGLPSLNQTGTTYTYNASPCVNAKVEGYAAASGWPPSSKGATTVLGKHIWDPRQPSDNDYTIAPQATGCFINTHGVAYRYTQNRRQYDAKPDGVGDGRADVKFVPATNFWADSTSGYVPWPAGARFPTDHPFNGKIRPDSPAGVRIAAYNATDNCATRIRTDSYLKPTIFTIGLGGTGGEETIDDELLFRLANDPASPYAGFDKTQPAGLYARADNPDQLQDAFQRVASQILRLAQ